MGDDVESCLERVFNFKIGCFANKKAIGKNRQARTLVEMINAWLLNNVKFTLKILQNLKNLNWNFFSQL